MKQHTIPRFYLEGFTAQDSPADQNPYVWIYDLNLKEWRKKSPKKILTKTNYYDVECTNGKMSRVFEKALSNAESDAAKAMRRIIAPGVTLEQSDRMALAVFVALMHHRVPGTHERINKYLTDIAKQKMMVMYNRFKDDDEAWEIYKQNHKDVIRNDLAHVGPEALDPSRYKIKIGHGQVLGTAFSALEQIADMISRMSWTFLLSGGPDFFITSDAPFFLVNPKSESPIYGHGLAFQDVEVTLPLNRYLALLIHWGNQETRWEPAATQSVRQINQRSYAGAQEMIVAPAVVFPGSDTVTS